VEGAACETLPTLFVANHVSYLDIPILGAVLEATFIAKTEVAGWPFFGHLARLTDTIFIRRHWRQALIQRNLLADRMGGGESLILFAEGTSGNGLEVLPLKSSLLSIAETGVVGRLIAVQPVALAHLRLADGTLIDRATCDHYAWYGVR
jgi:1-acyl-sn-glycerol-3-phosphate acyltransferase